MPAGDPRLVEKKGNSTIEKGNSTRKRPLVEKGRKPGFWKKICYNMNKKIAQWAQQLREIFQDKPLRNSDLLVEIEFRVRKSSFKV